MDSKRIIAVASLKKRNVLKGRAFDIHKAIGKLPRPKRGFVPHRIPFSGSL